MAPKTTKPDAPAPGIYYDVPEAEYRGWDAVNYSLLKGFCMGDTSEHFRYDREHPDEDEDSLAKAFGRVAEAAVLQPKVVRERFAVLPQTYPAESSRGRGENKVVETTQKPWNMNAGYCREWVAEKGTEGVECVRHADMERAKVVAASVWGHKAARRLLEGVKVQVCVVWKDPGSGMLCKARLDALHPQYGIGDLKTTRHRLPGQAVRAGYSLGYHIQSAMYTDGASTVLEQYDPEKKPIPFHFIFVESRPPHLVFVANGHSAFMEGFGGQDDRSDPLGYLRMGRIYQQSLRNLAYCIKHDNWFAHAGQDYPDGIPPDEHEMIVPRWAEMEF